ncbi:hypothetical protein ACLB2K_057087 [Fragaria x ananassa]
MASSSSRSSSRSRSRSNTKSQTTIKINNPHIGNLVFDSESLPSSVWEGDCYRDLAMEIGNDYTEEGHVPPGVVLTGIIDDVIIKTLAADPEPNFLGVVKECVMEMMGKGMQPNAKTYAGHAKMEEGKEYAHQKHVHLISSFKQSKMELAMLSLLTKENVDDDFNQRSFTPKSTSHSPHCHLVSHKPISFHLLTVLEAYAGHAKMEEGKEFLEEMKANGFVADKMAMRAMRRALRGKRPLVKIIINILFDSVLCRIELGLLFFTNYEKLVLVDNSEDYSGDSEEDDEDIKKSDNLIERFNIPRYVGNKRVIEDDPENPKDLECVYDMMCRMEPIVHTITRMVNMLKKDGFMSQAHEIRSEFDLGGDIPQVVTHTGVMEIYAKSDRAKEAHKGMQPNARTYTPVFKAFTRLEEDNVKKGKEFLMEMKAKGFRAKKKDVMEVLKGRKGHVVQTVISILFGK